MTEFIQRKLNDSPAMRWTALVLVASMMFFGYMFVDVMSPIQALMESQRGWTPDIFGTYAASEYILNVCGFLIIAGVILDKMGVRFTGELSASMMFAGAVIKYIGITDWFQTTAFADWLNTWWVNMPASAKMASLGFMLFGCGCEMAGTTVSKAIAKWFKGKEMALAMGLEMAIARVGVFAIFSISPIIADKFGTVVAPVAFCTVLLLIGLITFTVFTFMDKKLDSQLGEDAGEEASDEEFKFSDLGKILSSQVFWIVALLCVLYYSAIFPFQRYGANMLQCNLDGITAEAASNIFRWFPIGAAVITPFLGNFLDRKGKGATMLIGGALLLPPYLRLYPSRDKERPSCILHDSPPRHIIRPCSCCPLAECTEDYRREGARQRILSHLLGAEHRSLLCAEAYRQYTHLYQRGQPSSHCSKAGWLRLHTIRLYRTSRCVRRIWHPRPHHSHLS